MISERSSPSRVRCAAPGGAPLTAASRSEPTLAKREKLRSKRLDLRLPCATEGPITIASLQAELNLTKAISAGGKESEALQLFEDDRQRPLTYLVNELQPLSV